MSPAPALQKVAIVGAGGRVGGEFAKALLKTGNHTVTAITRAGSKSSLPDGIQTIEVNYDDEESIVAACKGQQFLAITLGVTAPPDLHGKIVKAAVSAGVKYIMPNVYGYDPENINLTSGNSYSAMSAGRLKEVTSAGGTYIALTCGFWYEWSLGLGMYGIDIANKTVVLMDDGKTKICTSTFPQCGRAFAALLSLPESGASPCLADWKNKPVYMNSFLVSQRDMLDSVNRANGTKDEDWTITHEGSEQRHKDAMEKMKTGDRRAFATAMYSRMFFQNGDGDYTSRGLANEVLGLPKENLDEATKVVVKMVDKGYSLATVGMGS
ncbi:NAD(P)-binding protein [Microthyrium microscopicum]|uniref:NAD(P)-binding protein n=1 Tax=Microthyrium microscopicum TaxID=703497 RepID=A0A6A6UB07_9PEZI|nr:NAD(P)-binding protein [Microthyrium microscopicum]